MSNNLLRQVYEVSGGQLIIQLTTDKPATTRHFDLMGRLNTAYLDWAIRNDEPSPLDVGGIDR